MSGSLVTQARAQHLGAVRVDAVVADRAHITALDVWAFVLPAASFIEITLVGRLIAIEILGIAMIPWLLKGRDRTRVPRWFLLLWFGWFVSQVVTDVVVGSVIADYSRGWSSIVFTLTNFVVVLALVSTPRRARLFAYGLAFAGVAGYFVSPKIYAASDPWKWAFAGPVGFVIAASLSGGAGTRRTWLGIGALVVFAVLNLLLGYRSLGGVSAIVAGYLLVNMLVGSEIQAARGSILRAGAGVLFCLIASIGILTAYDAAAGGGLLGSAAQAGYLSQSGQLGVLVGGRSAILVSTQAIIDSPVLGHGSWAKDFRYAALLSDRLTSLGYDPTATTSDLGLIPTHSYILGAWVSAGFLGGLFWFGVALLGIRLMVSLYSIRLAMAPLLMFSTVLLLWNVVFSPYGNSERVLAPYGIALCLLGLRLLRSGDAGTMAGLSLEDPVGGAGAGIAPRRTQSFRKSGERGRRGR